MRIFFPSNKHGYSHISADGHVLDDYIGTTLAYMICDCVNDIEMIRFKAIGKPEDIIVQKRMCDISLWIINKKGYEQ